MRAGVAQLVEQLIRNQQVTGSSPVTSSNLSADTPVSALLFFKDKEDLTWIFVICLLSEKL